MAAQFQFGLDLILDRLAGFQTPQAERSMCAGRVDRVPSRGLAPWPWCTSTCAAVVMKWMTRAWYNGEFSWEDERVL